jgi:hypothetical protein
MRIICSRHVKMSAGVTSLNFFKIFNYICVLTLLVTMFEIKHWQHRKQYAFSETYMIPLSDYH